MTDSPTHGQTAHRIRFDWGPTGAEHVTAEVAVVVDVLSFTTTLSVAVERGIEVFPIPDTTWTPRSWRSGTGRRWRCAGSRR
ncbi:2-phosphosulfolactate phosphatase [Nocardioides alcanivorans]|uniref:2-phosphosulfolactate phosphatase n=1 Tax=Nocardioides alcanivorans TaxID=2897352 RepID=UPI001F19EBA4|nr:2-phosphosulfolactate phosphatase [Nocardioides alcanivorans]